MAASLGIVFGHDPRRPWLADRSARSLRGAGFGDIRVLRRDEASPTVEGPLFLLRAGAWLKRRGPVLPPPPSATGRTVVAVGLPLTGPDAAGWRSVRARSGGEFPLGVGHRIVAAWVIPATRAPIDVELLTRLVDGDPLSLQGVRMVHWPAVDVFDGGRLRVVQVVTSLQRGGAERVAWDLHQCMPMCGVESALVTLGDPPRRSLPTPTRHCCLSGLGDEARVAKLAALASQFGADILHLHLVRADEAGRMAAATGLPVVMTIHNTRSGWPEGLARLEPDSVALLVACAQAVERDLEERRLPAPLRTAWNGIDTGFFASISRRPDPKRLTIACVANPRAQKRLDRLPAALAAVREELARLNDSRDTRLILAGELPVGGGRLAAAECLDAVRREADAHGVADHIEWTDGAREVTEVLAECDVVVSLSAHEGLSLALLEAMAAGVPVVATDVGGNAELAHAGGGGGALVAPDASPTTIACAVFAAAERDASSGAETVRRHFTREKMAARYAWLHRAALGPRRGETFWFVANNLSTGGAQSSLRRLAKTLHARGRRVRVVVLQEEADNPTPGRVDLESAGVPVLPLPPAGEIEPQEAVEQLLAELSADPPRAVTFWNALQSYKALIADALLYVPVFDVSPGEMFYTSLDAYFAKPRAAFPYRTSRDYGARLAGVVVKYAAEAPLAADRLGAPVHVIPNGVALPNRVPRPHDGRFVIGTAARLHPHKRLEDLIDAFRLALPRLPPSELRVAGAPDFACDEYAADLQKRSLDLPVTWLGGVSDMAAIHAGLDLFAMISEPAGCPNASLEAMAAGLSVVATDVGGAAEQVTDGQTGRIVPPRDVKPLADALVELGVDAARRRRMGAAGRERIERFFSLDRMADAYQTVLDANRPATEDV